MGGTVFFNNLYANFALQCWPIKNLLSVLRLPFPKEDTTWRFLTYRCCQIDNTEKSGPFLHTANVKIHSDVMNFTKLQMLMT